MGGRELLAARRLRARGARAAAAEALVEPVDRARAAAVGRVARVAPVHGLLLREARPDELVPRRGAHEEHAL